VAVLGVGFDVTLEASVARLPAFGPAATTEFLLFVLTFVAMSQLP
jgi:hypothetical protein